MSDDLQVGDFVRVLARGKWRNETGVVTNVYGGGLYARGSARVLFSSEEESFFLTEEIEFMEREVS